MPKLKLTPGRRHVLEAARDGNLYRSELIGSLYKSYIAGGHFAAVTVQANWLAKQNLIRIGGRNPHRRLSRDWVITNTGRAALEEA